MNMQPIESGFAQVGARFKVREIASRWRHGNRSWIEPTEYSLDIQRDGDRKSTRLNSSHQIISYAVFCLKKNNHPDAAAKPLARHALAQQHVLRLVHPPPQA